MTTTVAIHQPNYLPWLGYFAKIARSDIFVFLDDAQFPKGSYVNRVKIAESETPAWLTVAVNVRLGDAIMSVRCSRLDWPRAHRDRLFQTYRSAAHFKSISPEIEDWLLTQTADNLASVNVFLITKIASRLGLSTRFILSSKLPFCHLASDARLAAIVQSLAPDGVYLSGSGGANYQAEETFAALNLTLAYSDFICPTYDRGSSPFVAGLSIVDAVFHCGWDQVARMIEAK